MSQTKDIYDREVERLTADPELILNSWEDWEPLFYACADSAYAGVCGCLTQVHKGSRPAQTKALTDAIRDDARIPDACDIRPEHLPIFAEWQRRIDKELNRKPPQE